MIRTLIHLVLYCTLICITLFIGSTYYYYSPFYTNITDAVAVIHPTKNNMAYGIVTFTKTGNDITVIAELSGLTPGEHGFHIHEYGDCACDDAICAGDHFNPTHQSHGAPNDFTRHVGDLGNIVADEKGNAVLAYIDRHLTLNGPYSIIGRAIIVHEKKDDFSTQPTGDAGARVGCGVVGIKKRVQQ